jgi:hypothetical protein
LFPPTLIPRINNAYVGMLHSPGSALHSAWTNYARCDLTGALSSTVRVTVHSRSCDFLIASGSA